MCVCLECSSKFEFEGNAVFRVDVWNKSILSFASFLELTSFLPVSRDILLISNLAWLLVSNWKNNSFFCLHLKHGFVCVPLCLYPFPLWLSA